MKILLILFLSILSLNKSDKIFSYDVEENTTTISNHIPERKRSPIFPKNVKFIVKPTPDTNNIKVEADYKREKITTRKPLMIKMIPKFKKYLFTTTDVVTRKPLMKARTYTVKMKPSVKDNVEDGQRKRYFIKTDRTRSPKSRMKNEELDKVNSNKDVNANKISTKFLYPPELSSGKFSKEEEQDRHEFIFLEKKNKNIVIGDMLYVSEEDFETTTLALVTTKLRRKRSSNIIEEENMGTTVSPLKYTGRDTRLTNNLYFKNINQ